MPREYKCAEDREQKVQCIASDACIFFATVHRVSVYVSLSTVGTAGTSGFLVTQGHGYKHHR